MSLSVRYDNSFYWTMEDALSANIPIEFAFIDGDVSGIIEISFPEELIDNIKYNKIDAIIFDVADNYLELGVGTKIAISST